MPDIATLGLAVDSSQVVTAKTALQQLTAAAGPAAQSAAALTAATVPASAAMSKGTAAANVHSESLRGQRMVLRGLAADLAILGPQYGQVAGMAGLLYIENAHLFTGFGGLKNAISSLLTPTNLAIGAFAAIAVGSYAAFESIKATELAFGALSERTNTTVQALHGFESVAGFKGISTVDFLKDMEKFGDLSAQANNNLGSMADLFQANSVRAGNLSQNLLHAADLIANARSEADKYRIITQLGLPATREWVQYLSQGSAGLKAATDEAAKFGAGADEQLIKRAREFDEAWNKTWKNWTTSAKSAFVSVAEGMSDLSDSAANFLRRGIASAFGAGDPKANALATLKAGFGSRMDQTAANSFYSATGADRGNKPATQDPEVIKAQIAAIQQYISALGPLASVTQLVTQKQNELRLMRLQPGSMITDADVARISAYTAAQALGTIAIHTQADAQRIDTAAIGMGVGATAAFTAEQTRLADFRLRGIALTKEQTAALHDEALALGQVTQANALGKMQNDAAFARSQFGRTDAEGAIATQLRVLYGNNYQAHMNDAIADQLRMNQLLGDAKSISGNALSGFLQDLRAGKSAAEALSNALGKMADKLIDMASNALIAQLFKSLIGLGIGGGGGIGDGAKNAFIGLHSGGMVGTDSTFTRYGSDAAFIGAPRFHSGGMIGADEVPIIAKRGEGVFTPAQIKALGGAGSGNTTTISVSIPQNLTFVNSDPASEARMRAYVDMSNRQAVAASVQAVAEAHRKAPGTYLKAGH